MKKLNITFCSFPDYSSNARSLYEYMKKKYKNKINYTWVVNDLKIKEKLQKQGIDTIQINSEESKEKLKETDVFFTTHADLVSYKDINSKTLYVELWHGVSPKCMGFLINDISDDDSLWCENISKKIDYYVVPSKFWVPIFSARFHIYPKRCLPLGFPLFDSIIYSKGYDNLEKILECKLNKYKKVIYYMPTIRCSDTRNENVEINKKNVFNIKKYEEKKLLNYLEKNKYLLCIKYHPSEKNKFSIIESDYIKYIDETKLKKYELDTNKILNGSDLLITDYSSVGLHYLMLEKPVIYLTSDVDKFNSNRGILFGNFKFFAGDNQASDIETLLNKINVNLKSNSIAKDKKELLFGDLKDGGCENICNYFFTKDGKLRDEIECIEVEEEKLKNENIKLRDELNRINNSRGYRIIKAIRKIIKK